MICTIDEPTYDYDSGRCLELEKLVPGRDCTARLIIDPNDPEAYATDIWVTIDDLKTPKRRRFLPLFTDKRIAISFLIIDAVGNTSEDMPEEHYVKEDGTLYTSNNLFGGVLRLIGISTEREIERGYFLPKDGGYKLRKKPPQTASPQLIKA